MADFDRIEKQIEREAAQDRLEARAEELRAANRPINRGGDTWEDSGDLPLRTLRSVDVFEVSVVAFPAYEDTEAGLRSLEEARAAAENEIKEHNREGWLKRKAIALRERASELKFRKIPGQPEA